MTKEKFTLQVDLKGRKPIKFVGLPFVGTVLLKQEDNRIFFEKEKLEEVIQTLEACKKWLNSP